LAHMEISVSSGVCANLGLLWNLHDREKEFKFAKFIAIIVCFVH
jgi:hypothetical protein